MSPLLSAHFSILPAGEGDCVSHCQRGEGGTFLVLRPNHAEPIDEVQVVRYLLRDGLVVSFCREVQITDKGRPATAFLTCVSGC